MLLLNKKSLTAFAMLGALAISSGAYAGEYEGKWLLKDTNGDGFEAVFNHDGTASGTHGDSMKHGTWVEDSSGITITWDTGWITRIKKVSGRYVKQAFKSGVSLDGKPTNESDAIKQN